MNNVTIEELVDALEDMCLQYLSRPDGSMTHDFMSAGEIALDVLCRLGLATETGDGAIWVPEDQRPTIEEIRLKINIERNSPSFSHNNEAEQIDRQRNDL